LPTSPVSLVLGANPGGNEESEKIDPFKPWDPPLDGLAEFGASIITQFPVSSGAEPHVPPGKTRQPLKADRASDAGST
jgi:hypothetical protein